MLLFVRRLMLDNSALHPLGSGADILAGSVLSLCSYLVPS
uniref:Uncharacterized protein n=1 Tax=Aegilops tauschii subsp. strangulata TaxID=200361 RepID=A0A453QK60_AEGTS